MPGYTRQQLRRDILKEMILRECACQDQDEMTPSHGVKFHNNGPAEESGMIRSNLYTLSQQAREMHDMIDSNDDLDEWVQEKISVASSMIDSIYDYIGYEYKSLRGDVGSHDDHDPELISDEDHQDRIASFETGYDFAMDDASQDDEYDMNESDFSDVEFEDLDADDVMHEPWEPMHQSTGIMFFEENPTNYRRRR